VVAVSTTPAPRASGLSTGSLAGERATLRSLRTSSTLARRGRKVYRITEAGREEFARLLADPATLDDSRAFSLRMALARYLTPSLRITLLEQRRAALVNRLAEIRRHAEAENLDTYARNVMEHAARSVELDIAWIDSLLSDERTNQQTLAHEAN
jgi:DNA-binding PadR family transcriptional regulator